ncbi:MAG: hypothetical protein HKN12_02030 [Gemmatimonadetes bacterium]|nr:hypothetical protein [Gemmatimonadota bacterium]
MAESKLKTAAERSAGMSNDAVKSKTGRTWSQWYGVLDRAGAKKKTHKEIARDLYRGHDVTFWWAQTITVAYERARGLREKHESPSGFEASKSRTLNASRARVWKAWKDSRERGRWLDGRMRIRKATEAKSIRASWEDDGAGLQGTPFHVYFVAKGRGRCQVTVQHTKLAGARDVTRAKELWASNLEALRNHVEEA